MAGPGHSVRPKGNYAEPEARSWGAEVLEKVDCLSEQKMLASVCSTHPQGHLLASAGQLGLEGLLIQTSLHKSSQC